MSAFHLRFIRDWKSTSTDFKGKKDFEISQYPISTSPAPVDVVDPEDNPEVVPQPVVDPVTGDDGITDTAAKVSFSLPAEINTNGPVDRLVNG